jgi:hypothetical protein
MRPIPRPLAIAFGLLCPLVLTGCSGFWVFLDDTHYPAPHMNAPVGNSENLRLVQGKSVPVAPLRTETGNVWPGPVPPTPTLEDLARQPMQAVPPLEQGTPTPATSTVPTLVVPPVPNHLQPRPDQNFLNQPLPQAGSPELPPQSGQGGQGGPDNDRNLGVVVPNGNGTSTVIAPDGTITTIPTPH